MVISSAIDPNNVEAQVRRKLGLSCQLQRPRIILPHPSRGDSTGYSSWYWQAQLQKIQNNEEVKVSQATSPSSFVQHYYAEVAVEISQAKIVMANIKYIIVR